MQPTDTEFTPETISALLTEVVASYVEVPADAISSDTPLSEYGLDSVYALAVTVDIEEQLGISLDPTMLWDHPTIDALAEALAKQTADQGAPPGGTAPSRAVPRYLSSAELAAEAWLPEDITPHADALPPAVAPYRAVLLTGATGYAGAFLLRRLLDQGIPEVHVLVRAQDAVDAVDRVRENLTRYGQWRDGDEERVLGVPGDLSQPWFGLEETVYQTLAERVELVIHSAAFVNFVLPYARLRPANVLGTQEVLRFACRRRVKPVHFVSSMGVLPERPGHQVFPEAPVTDPDAVYGSYRQSKWVADRLVTLAGERGLPVYVYRPGNVTGPADTGVSPTDMLVNALIKGCVQLGAAMDFDIELLLVPVDYLAAAVTHSALSGTAPSGSVFNLPGKNLVNWNDLVEMINACGYPVRRLPYREWHAELVEHAAGNALAPYLPLFEDDAPGKELGVADNKPQIVSDNMAAQLAGTGITCRPVDQQLVSVYLGYLTDIGYLPPPANAARGLPAGV
jgi:thioester reductase-like protein